MPSFATQQVRTKDGGRITLRLTKGKAIKIFCMECGGWDMDPRECPSTICPLYAFRGRTFATQSAEERKGAGKVITEEQKAKMQAALKIYKEKKKAAELQPKPAISRSRT